MAQDKTYYLDEALFISAAAPTGAEIRFIGKGGGGPGSGGWGLSEGHPRGTSPTKPDIAQVISLRRVLTEEYHALEKQYEEEYSSQTTQLPETISKLRSQIKISAQHLSDPLSQASSEQQTLTSRITEIRENYLRIVPDANSYYGVPAFYKRGDSMMSRFLQPGVFTVTGEALGREFISRLQKSWEGAHRLHIEAQKHQALADDLKKLAVRVDKEELRYKPIDLAKVVERRTVQINAERQIYFNCLPNVLQHELSQQTRIDESFSLVQSLNAYLTTAANLMQIKQSRIPPFKQKNPQINSPLSKPQLEGLLHLVEEQRLNRAGPRWKEYHQALALTESVRFLRIYSSGTQNLSQRAAEVEQLLAQYAAQAEADRLATEAATRLRAEAERLAAEKAAQQRADAERLAAQAAARQQAEAERLAAAAKRKQLEAERQDISYFTDARIASSLPTITPIGTATFAIAESAATALLAAITAATNHMAAAAIAGIPHLAVAVLTAAWPSTLGNAERRYLISVPLSSLSPPGGPDLSALAMSSANVDIPYLLAGSEVENELGLYLIPGGKPIAVRAAAFDDARQVYSLALDNPQRILTWTPASAPGAEEGTSTSLPPVPPGTVVYTGSSLTPITTEPESYPALDLLDQERLIVTFPIDSGLPPILVVFKSPRHEPGVISGTGAPLTGIWLGEETRNTGALIPQHIAGLLRGKEYPDFDAFRIDFWKAVANDPELSKQFSKQNLIRMGKKGNAPSAREIDAYGLHKSFILHHVIPISEGGAVYDIDNLRVVTPSAHQTIHYGDKP